MEHFIAFAKLNWYLFAAFFIVLFLIISSVIQQKASGILTISAQGLLRLSNDNEALVVDVRDLATYRKGHIAGSMNVPMADIESKALDILSKNPQKALIIVCQSGVNAMKAAQLFKKHDFSKIYSLAGGIESWKQDHLPLSKRK